MTLQSFCKHVKTSVNSARMILFTIFTWTLNLNCSLYQAKLSVNMVLSCGSLWVSYQDFMNLRHFLLYCVLYMVFHVNQLFCLQCWPRESERTNVFDSWNIIFLFVKHCGQNEKKHRLKLPYSASCLFYWQFYCRYLYAYTFLIYFINSIPAVPLWMSTAISEEWFLH